MTILNSQKAHLIHEYYLLNKSRLAKFEPLRPRDFFTLSNWEMRTGASFKNFLDGTSVNFVALDKEFKTMLGAVNFTGIAMGPFKACFMGFSITGDMEGKGLATEIVSAGINFMFSEKKLHRIMANHLPQNIRSANLLKKLGFEKEGYAKSYLKIAGQWQDHVLNSLVNPADL